MSQIQDVCQWIKTAGQEKTEENLALYLSLILEETAEMLDAIHEVDIHDAVDLGKTARNLHQMSLLMREGLFVSNIAKADKAKLMDAAFDTAWVSMGAMHQLGNAETAWSEGSSSNYSKFDPNTGRALKDDTGKVIKSASFRKPDFSKTLEVTENVYD